MPDRLDAMASITSAVSQFDVVGLGLNSIDTICVVDEFPKPQSKAPIRRVYTEAGGQVATALVTTARLGLRSRYIGSVGNDDRGRVQLASLQTEGLDTEFVRIVEGASSTMAVILVEERIGERSVLWHRDERLRYPASELQREIVCSGRILHLDGCDSEAAIQAARWARESSIPVVIDIDEIYGESTHELLSLVDYLIAAEEFAARVAGNAPPAETARILAERYKCRVVGVTRGAQGAVFVENGRVLESAAFSIQAVDTTGAGDVFHGAFIYGVLQSWNLEDTVRFAHAAAALKCTQIGARRGIPGVRQVAEFLKQNV